jgi:hypothetical protein
VNAFDVELILLGSPGLFGVAASAATPLPVLHWPLRGGQRQSRERMVSIFSCFIGPALWSHRRNLGGKAVPKSSSRRSVQHPNYERSTTYIEKQYVMPFVIMKMRMRDFIIAN